MKRKCAIDVLGTDRFRVLLYQKANENGAQGGHRRLKRQSAIFVACARTESGNCSTKKRITWSVAKLRAAVSDTGGRGILLPKEANR